MGPGPAVGAPRAGQGHGTVTRRGVTDLTSINPLPGLRPYPEELARRIRHSRRGPIGPESDAMCLAFPMCIRSIDGLSATCSARGSERAVSLWLLQGEPLAVGDWLLVHLDRAIRRISPEEADAAWALFDEILAAVQPQTAD